MACQKQKQLRLNSRYIKLIIQVAELAELTQLLPPRSPAVRNPAPDSSLCRLQSCSPIASASAAAPGPDCGIHFNCCSPLPPLLLPDCVCCSPLASASAAAPDRVHFGCYSPIVNCCSPITSASTAAPRLRPL